MNLLIIIIVKLYLILIQSIDYCLSNFALAFLLKHLTLWNSQNLNVSYSMLDLSPIILLLYLYLVLTNSKSALNFVSYRLYLLDSPLMG